MKLHILGLALALCAGRSNAAALRARNSTASSQKLTGLLCREAGPDNNDVDVVLEEGGRRSLLFSKRVMDGKGNLIGREAAGMQSTVHCATEVTQPKDRQCTPADLDKPVPSCTVVGQMGNCACVPIVNEPLKLPYQQQMASKALELCEAKAKAKQPFRVLMFGLGGGAVPMYIRHRCEAAVLESVESDPRVALLAQRLFGFKADSKNRVEIADGEEAAERHAKTHPWPAGPHYDIVLVDCFDGESHVASSCRSEKFLHSIETALGPDGTVLHNVMDTDVAQLLPMYQATFGATQTTKETVQNGQFLIVAKTHSTHPRHA
jgi:hypothetical protein